MDPNQQQPATPATEHIEPPIEAVAVANPDALAALEASLAGEAPPAADEGTVNEPDATAAKESSAATEGEPDDAAAKPDPAATKPDDAPADDAAPKRPSDEFGELPKDAKADTRERFEKLKTSYDAMAVERDEARQVAQQWQEMIASTGATAEQFGSSLQYLSLVNAGTPEGLQQAYDLLSGELASLGKLIGREVPGAYDPLDEFPDLKQRVGDHLIDRADALEIAQAKKTLALSEANTRRTTQQSDDQADLQARLSEVQSFGEQMRASDPLANAKLQAIAPIVKRVVANLPRGEWMGAIREAYAAAVVAPPVQDAPPAVPGTTLRNTSTPGAGASKSPGSALEAMEAALAANR